jgi:hypothetical protein
MYIVEELEGGFDIWANHDVNSIPPLEHYEMSYARGRCWDTLQWFFSLYEIFDKASNERIDGFAQVAMPYLVHNHDELIELTKC